MLSLLLAIAQFLTIDGERIEDSYDAMVQMSHSATLVMALLANVMSMPFFNFIGMTVTQDMSAAHRMMIEIVCG